MAELSQDPARWRAQAGRSLDPAGGLAERQKAVDQHLERAAKGGWKDQLAPVAQAAARESKLVLLFQLVGDLDFEGC